MIKEYLLTHLEEAKRLVREINSYDCSLGYLEVFENDEEFFDTFFCESPNEAVRSALYGDYTYTDDYVRFDGYNNLESFDEWEYDRLIERHIDDIATRAKELVGYIDICSERLEELLEGDEKEYLPYIY